MRVTSLIPDAQYGIQQSQQALQQALEQLSTGKRVNQIADDPSAYSNNLRSLAQSANVDRYTSNINTVMPMMQTADSALSGVVTSLNKAITLGTQGATGTLTDAQRQGIAVQVQSILSTVVSQANTSVQGVYVFGGTASTTAPFTADATSTSGYKYNGSSNVNQVKIGDNSSVGIGVAGDRLFTSGPNVLGSLAKLVSALQSGNTTDIANAAQSITTSVNYVNQQRIPLDNSISAMTTQETYLSQETVTLTSQQTQLVGIDTATAATNLAQAQAQNNAVLAAAAKVMPQSLLDYLK